MIKTREIEAMARDAFKTADEKGWHDVERSYDDIIALINSELGEAVEELRKNADFSHRYYREDGKPEGFTVEVADAIVRVFDSLGLFKQHDEAIKTLAKGYKDTFNALVEQRIIMPEASGLVNTLMVTLAGIYNFMEQESVNEAVHYMGGFVAIADHWFLKNKVSLEAILKEKMQFNKSREYRHGNRVM